MVSGYSCYVSKHRIIMGTVVLLTRDPQLSKSICSRQNCKFLFDYQCHCLVMGHSIWIVLSDND